MSARLQAGRRPKSPARLQHELDRRLSAVHAAMRDGGTSIVVFVCAGIPGLAGWVRYLTGAPAWGPRAFVVLETGSFRRLLITRSPDDANWFRFTAIGTDVESTLIQKSNPIDRLVTFIRERAGPNGRVGIVNPDALSPVEAQAVRTLLPGSELVDVTQAMNGHRQVKSPFEIKTMQETGRLLTQGLERFAEIARPGRLALEVAGEIDGFMRAGGCGTGHLGLAFEEQSIPGPAPRDRRFGPDDIILLRLAYAGQFGYWYETTGVFSFRAMPDAAGRRFEAAQRALLDAARAATPGISARVVREAADRQYTASGFPVIGHHEVDVHTIGTDEDEAPSYGDGEQVFRDGMTVAIHPAPRLADDRGYFLAETFLIREGGAVHLSPPRSRYKRIETS